MENIMLKIAQLLGEKSPYKDLKSFFKYCDELLVRTEKSGDIKLFDTFDISEKQKEFIESNTDLKVEDVTKFYETFNKETLDKLYKIPAEKWHLNLSSTDEFDTELLDIVFRCDEHLDALSPIDLNLFSMRFLLGRVDEKTASAIIQGVISSDETYSPDMTIETKNEKISDFLSFAFMSFRVQEDYKRKELENKLTKEEIEEHQTFDELLAENDKYIDAVGTRRWLSSPTGNTYLILNTKEEKGIDFYNMLLDNPDDLIQENMFNRAIYKKAKKRVKEFGYRKVLSLKIDLSVDVGNWYEEINAKLNVFFGTEDKDLLTLVNTLVGENKGIFSKSIDTNILQVLRLIDIGCEPLEASFTKYEELKCDRETLLSLAPETTLKERVDKDEEVKYYFFKVAKLIKEKIIDKI